ncbi:MAG: hypothetical protein ACTHMM_08265 [Agriterribacter sp.]
MNFRVSVLLLFVATVLCLMLSAFAEGRKIAEILRTTGLILLWAMVVRLILFILNHHLTTIKNKINKLIVGRRSV